MRRIVFHLCLLSLTCSEASAFDLPRFRCKSRDIPTGTVSYRLSSASERLVRSKRCVKAGTKLTVLGKITGREGDYENLSLQISPVNFRSNTYRSALPTLNEDGTFEFVVTTPRHFGPTGDPSPQSIRVSVSDPTLAIDLPNFPYDGICEMRSKASRNVSFRACVQR